GSDGDLCGRGWRLRLPTSAAQRFRHFRNYWVSGATRSGVDLASRNRSQGSRWFLLGHECNRLVRDRGQSGDAGSWKLAVAPRSGRLWNRTALAVRCLVHLAGGCWCIAQTSCDTRRCRANDCPLPAAALMSRTGGFDFQAVLVREVLRALNSIPGDLAPADV